MRFMENAAKQYDVVILSDITSDTLLLDPDMVVVTGGLSERKEVIDGINRAVGEGLHIRLDVGLKEGYNDDEVLDFLQLTLMHKYDVVFLPTMDYNKIKAKMPGLRKIDGDFGDVEMYKYAVAKGRIGFLKD